MRAVGRARAAVLAVLAVLALAAAVRASWPAPLAGQLPTGAYFGWVGGGASRFQLLGAPCADGDSLLRAELSSYSLAGAQRNSQLLVAPDVTSGSIDLGQGRQSDVVELSSAALQRLTRPLPESSGRATGPRAYTFTHARALCRSWSEVGANIGQGSVLAVDGPVGASAALEAHVLPVPDRTRVIALVLLWNRSAHPVVLEALRYAPAALATHEVLAVSGSFEEYQQLEAAVFADSPLGSSAADHERAAEPGRERLALRLDSRALDLSVAPSGLALLALDRGSLAVGPTPMVLLSYPVVTFLSAGERYTLGVTAPVHVPALGGAGR